MRRKETQTPESDQCHLDILLTRLVDVSFSLIPDIRPAFNGFRISRHFHIFSCNKTDFPVRKRFDYFSFWRFLWNLKMVFWFLSQSLTAPFLINYSFYYSPRACWTVVSVSSSWTSIRFRSSALTSSSTSLCISFPASDVERISSCTASYVLNICFYFTHRDSGQLISGHHSADLPSDFQWSSNLLLHQTSFPYLFMQETESLIKSWCKSDIWYYVDRKSVV